VTRGKGVRPFGEHVDDDLVPVYFAEITSVKCPPKQWIAGERADGNSNGNAGDQSRPQAHLGARPRAGHAIGLGHPIIAVFTATGIRAAELAAIRYDAHDPQASDVDLWQLE
jgi:hypothetical protein